VLHLCQHVLLSTSSTSLRNIGRTSLRNTCVYGSPFSQCVVSTALTSRTALTLVTCVYLRVKCLLVQGVTPLRGDVMVVTWMRDVVDVAELRRVSDGALLAPLALPSLGTMSGVLTEPRRRSTEFWFSMTSFVDPSAQYRCDAATLLEGGVATGGENAVQESPDVVLFDRTQLKVEHDPDAYVTKQVGSDELAHKGFA
jgi:Prolyl oligopeptidase, N-terminal beta-propeller domain